MTMRTPNAVGTMISTILNVDVVGSALLCKLTEAVDLTRIYMRVRIWGTFRQQCNGTTDDSLIRKEGKTSLQPQIFRSVLICFEFFRRFNNLEVTKG